MDTDFMGHFGKSSFNTRGFKSYFKGGQELFRGPGLGLTCFYLANKLKPKYKWK